MDERGTGPRAVILERNRLVGRRLSRFFTCAGYDAVAVDDPVDLPAQIPGAYVLGADAFDIEQVLQSLRANPNLRVVLWTAEPLQRSLGYLVDQPAISNVLGRPDFDSSPRACFAHPPPPSCSCRGGRRERSAGRWRRTIRWPG